MDVWQYAEDRRRELRDLRLADEGITLEAAGEAGQEGQRGRIIGRAFLNARAFIQFHEVIRVEGSGITREKYAYYLCIDDVEIGGYERNPTHDPAEHKHCSVESGHRPGEPASAVSFKQAVESAWAYLSREDNLA